MQVVVGTLPRDLFTSSHFYMSQSSPRTTDTLDIIRHSSDAIEYRVKGSARWIDGSAWLLVVVSFTVVAFTPVSQDVDFVMLAWVGF